MDIEDGSLVGIDTAGIALFFQGRLPELHVSAGGGLRENGRT
jgi:hypothetical protein